MHPLVINFTPTGMIPLKKDCPAVPITSNEIVEDVHRAWELGITCAHLHARKDDGTPSSEAADYAPILEGVRRHCPGLVICTSLSGRTVSDPAARAEVLSLRPDMASLTLSSLNFAQSASINAPETVRELARRIDEAGATPELEVFDLGMANYLNYLIKKRWVKRPLYINILLGNIAGAQLEPAHLAGLLQGLPEDAWVALGGLGQHQLDAYLVALGLGLGIRLGLEDNIHWDRARSRTATNLELLQRVHELAERAERPLMTPEAFGALGFYNRHRSQNAAENGSL